MNTFKNELESLSSKIEEVKRYRDKVIAHNDLYNVDKIPQNIGNFSYKNLYDLSDYVFEVTKYLKFLLESKDILIDSAIESDLRFLF